MKGYRVTFYILIAACVWSVSLQAADKYLGDQFTETINEYEYVENGIHYGFLYYQNSFGKSQAELSKLWHDENAEIPEYLKLPSTITASDNSKTITFSEPYNVAILNKDIPLSLTNFNIVDFGTNNITSPDHRDWHGYPGVDSSSDDDIYENYAVANIQAKKLISNNKDVETIEGALIRYFYDFPAPYQIEPYKVVAAMPVLANRLSYTVPQEIYFRGLSAYRCLQYPINLPENPSYIIDYKYYPFAGISLPESYSDKMNNISYSHFKTFENVTEAFVAFDLEAVTLHPNIEQSDLNDIYNYCTKLKYIEIKSPSESEISVNTPSSMTPRSDDNVDKIITFVRADLVEEYQQWQREGKFPQNTEIRPTENFIYLAGELDNGCWVENDGRLQSQFIYAACRFGNTQISEIRWESDNSEVTVNENGVVSIPVSVSEDTNTLATITCSIIDNSGNIYTAKSSIDLTNPTFTNRGASSDLSFEKCNFQYEHIENGIHFNYQVYARKYFKDVSAILTDLWHEQGIEVPDVVKIPEVHGIFVTANSETTRYNPSEFNFTIKNDDTFINISNSDICDDLITFNVVDFGRSGFYLHNPNDPFDTSGESYIQPSVNLICKDFIRKHGYEENGAILIHEWEPGYFDTMNTPLEIIALPALADWISYRFPDSKCVLIQNPANKYLKYPIILNDQPYSLGMSRFSFADYPFAAVIDDYGLINEYQPIPIDNSKLKTFENAGSAKDTPALEAIISSFNIHELYSLFNSSAHGNNLKFIEFKGIQKNNQYSYIKTFKSLFETLKDEKEIITFIPDDVIEKIKNFQKDGYFPPNAVIKPVESLVYLSPELDHGQWVKTDYASKSQFLYAACRFGESVIEKTEWMSDHPAVGVDENGVVTITRIPRPNEKSTAKITCTITDNNNVQTASLSFELTNDICPEKNGISECDADLNRKPGVYNMQGMYLGEKAENLPAGLYIINGKKVMISE